jgi:hypothetical protein
VVPNALGRTVHFPGNGKGKGSCCGIVFMTFQGMEKGREAAVV